MPKYSVTKTETAEVWANNESHAEELANEQFADAPDANYEVTRLTPEVNASLHEVKHWLESFGIVPVDVLTNDPHGYPDSLSIGVHKATNYEGNLVPCARFNLFGKTDDGENWNGEGWELQTCECEQVAEFTNLDSMALAGALAYQIGRAMFDLESRGRGE